MPAPDQVSVAVLILTGVLVLMTGAYAFYTFRILKANESAVVRFRAADLNARFNRIRPDPVDAGIDRTGAARPARRCGPRRPAMACRRSRGDTPPAY